LLADLDNLDELGRIGVEVHHVAGFACGLSAGIHGDADVCLCERRRVVGAAAEIDAAPPNLAAEQTSGVLCSDRRSTNANGREFVGQLRQAFFEFAGYEAEVRTQRRARVRFLLRVP
jgi:hypothetical protein